MDKSRLKDLAQLTEIINDDTKPRIARESADIARKNIIKQLNDKKLQAMRERLIKASEASDEYNEWKISNQIKDYLGEATMDRYS